MDPRTQQAATVIRQLGTSRPTSAQMKTQIEEVKTRLNEFSLIDCREKVGWLTTIAMQQLTDLDLLRCSAQTVEEWTCEQLRRLDSNCSDSATLAKQKRKLEERLKQQQREKADVEKRNEELEQDKDALEKEAEELKAFKLKHTQLRKEHVQKVQALEKEAEEFKEEREVMQKQLEHFGGEREKLNKRVDRLAKELELERNSQARKAEETRREEEGMRQRIKDLERQLIGERRRNQENNRDEGKQYTAEAGSQAVQQLREELDEKRAEIDELKAERAQQVEETKRLMDKAKHKIMKQKEQLRLKREELEAKGQKAEEEKQRRERAEQVGLQLETELRSERKRRVELERNQQQLKKQSSSEQAVNKPTAPADAGTGIGTSNSTSSTSTASIGQMDLRIREMVAKKKQLEKAFKRALKAEKAKGKCEKCQEMEEELDKTRQKSEELTAVVMSRDVEINHLKVVLKATLAAAEEGKKEQNGLATSSSSDVVMLCQPSANAVGQEQQQRVKKSKKRAAERGEAVDGEAGGGKRMRIQPTTAMASNESTGDGDIVVCSAGPIENLQAMVGPQPTQAQEAFSFNFSPQSIPGDFLTTARPSSQPQPVYVVPCCMPSRPDSLPQPGLTAMPNRSTPPQQQPKTARVKPQPFTALRSLLQQPQDVQAVQAVQAPMFQLQQPEGLSAEQMTYQNMASKIVTDFMFFLGQPLNIAKNAATLIPEFIRRAQLPNNEAIAAQLLIIAEEAERVKGVKNSDGGGAKTTT